jgi:hypothetical protein
MFISVNKCIFVYSKTIKKNNMKNATKKISTNARLFFDYTFKGDGKYYTTEQGSKSYRNSIFQNFYTSNKECIDILEHGNDAPRGGQTGNYVIVKFNDNFKAKWNWYFEELEAKKQRIAALKAIEAKELKAIGNQADKLKQVFAERPDRLERIKEKINTSSSKDWRSWVKLKVCKWVVNSRFDLLRLSPSEIRDIAYSL